MRTLSVLATGTCRSSYSHCSSREIKHRLYSKQQTREFVPHDQAFHLLNLLFTVHYNYMKIGRFKPILSRTIVLSCFYLPISHLEIYQLESHVCHKRDAWFLYYQCWALKLAHKLSSRLRLTEVCSYSPCEKSLLLSSWLRRRKWGFVLTASSFWSRRILNFWVSQSCSLSSNWFFEPSIRLLIRLWS